MKRQKVLLVAIAICAVFSAIAFPAYAHAAAASTFGHTLRHADLLMALHGTHFSGIGAASLGAMAIGQVASVGGSNNLAAETKLFRIAVEGATTDGRAILREWLVQMAANYNAETYAARLNCEHIRGVAPMTPDGYSPFGAYGDVTALQASEITDGPLKGKMALYAQINPTQGLVDLTKARQKIYSSCEIDPSFADTKQAYLVGLAVTDSPASLGTEILSFAAGQGKDNPFAARKLSPQNLFSVAEEVNIEFAPAIASPEVTAPSVFARVGEMLGLVKKKATADDTRFADMTQAVETLAQHGQSQSGIVQQLSTQVEQLTADLKAQTEAREASDKALKELTESLSQQSAPGQRPLATGTSGAVRTDC